MDPTDYEYEYEQDEEPRPGGRILWGRVAALGLALVLTFVLGRCSAGAGAAEDEVAELEVRIERLLEDKTALEAQLDALQAGGAESSDAPGEAEGADDEEGDDGAGEAGADDGEDSDEQADADDERRTHEVQKGDYLYTLAEDYYGDGARWTLIADANDVSREDPTIRPGMVLEIPPDPAEE